MADTKQVRKSIKQLQRIKTWQLLILLILALVLTATFLRLNNIGMIERRTAVINADKLGEDEITQARLFDLQRYSSEHMNADSGTVYLEGQYNRDVEAAIKDVSQSGDNNPNVKADRVCRQQFGGYSQAYVQCFATELAKVPAGSNAPDKASLPNTELYRSEFISPIWSPDFAGISSFVSAIITLVIIARLLSLLLLKALLRRHYSSV